jgi:hypothetical protein
MILSLFADINNLSGFNRVVIWKRLRKLVGSERYRFLRRDSRERFAVQLPLDLLFPTELLRFEPFKFEG